MLDVGAKRRLVGAVFLVVLAVVFLPMLLEDEAVRESVPEEELRMPDPPIVERGRSPEVFPSVEETGPRPASGSEPGRPTPGLAPKLATESGPDAEGEPLLEPEPDAPGESQAARDESDLAKPQVPAKPPAASAKSETTKPRPPATDATQKPKSTVAAAPKPVPKGLSSWVVQVAALSTPEAAQRLQSDLRSKGFHAFVEKAEGASRTLWRVRVGPEVERKRAEALATDVKKRTGHDAVVQKYRDG